MNPLTHLDIDLDQLHHNVLQIIAYKKGAFMFVLKGNAYGHGYIEIVKELNRYESVSFYGVSSCLEARILAPHTKKKIVVLGYTHPSCFDPLVESNIIATISNIEDLIRIKNQEIFLNVDSGFHRLGIEVNALNHEKISQHKNIVGIFTHLTLHSRQSDLNQIERFTQFTKDLNIQYKSISDSIAYTRYQNSENLYRIGALLYGLTSQKEKGIIDVKPIQSLSSTITRIHTVKEDSNAFYRSKVGKGTVLATIQIGYADGLFRDMKDAYVLVRGKRCKYVEVGMDQSIIDVTNIKCKTLDSVIIFGKEGISLESLSTKLGTNKNNIIANISSRVTRKYYSSKTIQYVNQYGVQL